MTTPLTGLVVLGSNGEAPQLEDAEADWMIDIVRSEVPSQRPLIAGTGRESTKATIAATKRAAAAGVDAVLVRTPSFFKPQMTADVFERHYLEVADASPVPVLLYNVTMYTGVNLAPDVVAHARRASEHRRHQGVGERHRPDRRVRVADARRFFRAGRLGGDARARAVRRVRRRRARAGRARAARGRRPGGAGGTKDGSRKRARCSAA